MTMPPDPPDPDDCDGLDTVREMMPSWSLWTAYVGTSTGARGVSSSSGAIPGTAKIVYFGKLDDPGMETIEASDIDELIFKCQQYDQSLMLADRWLET